MRHGFDPSTDPIVLLVTILVLIPGCYLVRRAWRNFYHAHRLRRRLHGRRK